MEVILGSSPSFIRAGTPRHKASSETLKNPSRATHTHTLAYFLAKPAEPANSVICWVGVVKWENVCYFFSCPVSKFLCIFRWLNPTVRTNGKPDVCLNTLQSKALCFPHEDRVICCLTPSKQLLWENQNDFIALKKSKCSVFFFKINIYHKCIV